MNKDQRSSPDNTMKTTIITSIITTLAVNLLIHFSGITLWLACGVLACIISNKLDHSHEKLNHKSPWSWGLIIAGPCGLIFMVCLFAKEIMSLAPFKFQSPITKVKTDVAAV